jgi:D-serine deaminase-like pyridoxal phosphate-dependent protein
MVLSRYTSIDTPALLIDNDRLQQNIRFMQEKANKYGVSLRPHIKTHKMPRIAQMQLKAGAAGITTAKIGEAEVMAAHGIDDIFIANQIAGEIKYKRLRELNKRIKVSIGIDSVDNLIEIQKCFRDETKPLDVLVEIEVGENRSGVVLEDDLKRIVSQIMSTPQVRLKGVFSHEGHCYGAKDSEECKKFLLESQERVLGFVDLLSSMGTKAEVVSIGSTPSMMVGEIVPGITEIRPGTYVLMDMYQSNAIKTTERCAATVLGTVTSTPTDERFITDTGAKALTLQTQVGGMCATQGFGYIKGSNNKFVSLAYDEHGIFYDRELRGMLKVGDKIEIIPNHICPVSNLYDKAYLVSDGKVLEEMEVSCRGKSQ